MQNIYFVPMQKESDPMNLRSLAAVEPPEDDWPVIRAALEQDGKRKLRRRGTLLATAAVVVMAAVLVFLPGQQAPGVNTGPGLADSGQAGTPIDDGSAAPVTDSAATLASLITLSQQLETNVKTIRSRLGPMSTEALVYQVELEDLVAQVDDGLSQSPDSLQLWSQRVNLLLDLNQLYQQELRREYHYMASL